MKVDVMSKCKLAIYSEDRINYFTCDEVKVLKNHWIDKFIKTNAINVKIPNDQKKLIAYRDQIEHFLFQCECLYEMTEDDYKKTECTKCPKEYHKENGFCTCVTRNLVRARYLRWKSNQEFEKTSQA